MKPTEPNSNDEIVILEMGGSSDLLDGYLKDYFTHILCHKGTASFRMENRQYAMGKNDIAICLPSLGVHDLKFSRDFKATCFFVSYELISKNNPDIGWGIKGYLFSKENPVVHLSKADVTKCLTN